MKQLSGLDGSFLHMETPEMPMHVGALHLFELPADYKGRFVDDIRAHMAARLPLLPALRRKLADLPLKLANPVWVDAEPDLARHIVSIKLKRPKAEAGATDATGDPTMALLEAQVGLLHPRLLDRSRPLWKFHVFEGLPNGPGKVKRFGLYTQLHHAAVDGQAAVALANVILDLGPVPREIAAGPRPSKRVKLGMAEMLSGVLAHQLRQYAGVVKALPGGVSALANMARLGAGGLKDTALAKLRGEAGTVSNLRLAPRTRLNVSVSATRAFASASLPMAGLKALRRAHDASLNDVVLMVCSGALRRQFLKHGPLPRKSLVAGVPVSLRAAGDTTSNNQAAMTFVSLGTHIADPMKRLLHVKEATAAMKATLGNVKTLMPTDFPSLGVPWLMSSLTSLFSRAKVADRLPPLANVAISNVPGPAFPLYMAGAKMLTNYPTSIVMHGVALNITVQSYNENLDVGLIACGEAMPDVAELAVHLHEAMAELQALPPTAADKPPAAKAPVTAPPAAAAPAAAEPAATETPAKPSRPRKATPPPAKTARTPRKRAQG